MSTEIRRLLGRWRLSLDISKYQCADELEALLASQRPPTEDVCPAHDTQGYGCELPRGHREPHECLRGLAAFKQWEEYEPPAPAVPSPADPQPTSGSLAQEVAAIAWACVKECKDHQPPPVLCVKHQLEAEAAIQRLASPADPQPDLLKLIERIVTGDGAQLENLDLSDAEWDALCEDVGNDPEHFEVTMRLEDWKALARVARASPAGHPSTEAQKDEGYQEALHRPVKGKP